MSAEVDVFDGGRASLAALRTRCRRRLRAFGELTVDEHGEAFLEAERRVVGVLALLEEAAGHARQPQRGEPVEGGVVST